jgi:hypothetical protein
MRRLAARVGPAALAADPGRAYALYERFRPAVASGAAGWGAAGDLRLADLLRLAAEAPPHTPPAAVLRGPPHHGPPTPAHGSPALPLPPREPDAPPAQAAGGGAAGGGAAERVLAAVGRAGAGGLSAGELEATCGEGAAEAAEELQLEGALYARVGSLHLL